MSYLVLIGTNGHCDVAELPEPGSDSQRLGTLQALVGGYLESVPDPLRGFTVYVNEDARCGGLPVNPYASGLLQTLGIIGKRKGVCGPLIIMGPHGTGLSASYAADICTIVADPSKK